jgi:hypothetical protein
MPEQFSVQIKAEDQGNPKMHSFATLLINIVDIDDQNPVFSSLIYVGRMFNTENSSIILTEPGPVKACDGDSINETIVYKIEGGKKS